MRAAVSTAAAVVIFAVLAGLASATVAAAGVRAGVSWSSCRSLSTQATCNANRECFWNIYLDECRVGCDQYSDSGPCVANPSCEWGEGRCYTNCQLMTDSRSQCLSSGGPAGCIFEITENFCDQNCSLPLEQCVRYSACVVNPFDHSCMRGCRSNLGPVQCAYSTGARCVYNATSQLCEQGPWGPPTPVPPVTPSPPDCCGNTCAQGCCGECDVCYDLHCYSAAALDAKINGTTASKHGSP